MIPKDAIPLRVPCHFSEAAFSDAVMSLRDELGPIQLDGVVLSVSISEMMDASRLKETINNSVGNFKILDVLLDCDLMDIKDECDGQACGAFYVSSGGKCVYSRGV